MNKDIKKLPLDEHKIQIKNTLENSVKKMMVADVEAGCFLSGGVDSSLVALLMQRNSSRKIKTFNVGFYESEYDESNFARLMAKTIGTEHHQIKLNKYLNFILIIQIIKKLLCPTQREKVAIR